MTDRNQAPTLGQLLHLAWPIVVSRSTQVVIGLCDALMVARLGEAALAATTTGALNAFAVLIFPMGVVFIVSSFASQMWGAGDPAGARRYGWYGLAVAGAAQGLGLALLPLVPRVLGLLHYDPAVRALMTDYLTVRLLSCGAAIGMEALANYYGGLGNTRLPMIASIVAMVLNVVGSWAFIYGHLGAPAMGVKGTALAATLATTIAFLGILTVFLAGGRARGGLVPPGLSARELLRMLRFGVPAGFNWFTEFFAFNFFINVVVAGLGTTALAALMAVFQLNSLSFMPAFAVASAGSIFVGQLLGARRTDEVPRTVRLTLLTAGAWQGLVGLAYLLLPALLFLPFVPAGATGGALLRAGVRMLMLSAAWQLFDATVATLAESLRAAGDTAFTMWARTIIAWLIFAPGSYATVRYFGGGDVAAVAWVVLYLGLLAGVLGLRFRGGMWRRMDLFSSSEYLGKI